MDLYPLVFKLYRHTTNPAPLKSSNLPWPLASLLTSVGLLSNSPTVSAPLLTTGDDTSAPPQPRRVPYYQAAFPKTTTLAQVSQWYHSSTTLAQVSQWYHSSTTLAQLSQSRLCTLSTHCRLCTLSTHCRLCTLVHTLQALYTSPHTVGSVH